MEQQLADAQPGDPPQARPDHSPAIASVDGEAVRQLAIRELGAALTSPLASGLLVFTVWGSADPTACVIWMMSNMLIEGFNALLSWRLMRHHGDARRRRRLIGMLGGTVALSGLTWGLVPFLLAVPGDIRFELLYVVYLLVAASVSVHTFSLHLPMMWAFLVPMILPAAVTRLLSGDRFSLTIGLGMILASGLSLFYGTISGRLGRQGIAALREQKRIAAEMARNNADLQTANQTIREIALRDPLTQCFNRRAMLEHGAREMSRQDRGGPSLGLLLIDVDHFKQVNDVHGHQTGDDVLQALVARVETSLRPVDLMSRFGGEEFACLISLEPGTDQRDRLRALAERIRESIAAAPLLMNRPELRISCSIGGAVREHAEDWQSLVHRTDRSLYRAKGAGRNRVELAAQQMPLTRSGLPA